MEESRLLNVPITEREFHQRNTDRERLLTSSYTTNVARNDEVDPSIGRFKSLRSTIYQVNTPQYVDGLPAGHRRISSVSDEEPRRTTNFSQPTAYNRQATYDLLDYPPDLWVPIWVRKSTLTILLLFFLVIVAGLIVLWYFSRQFNGFNITSSATYYVWTYVPVAFMVLLVGIWRQVDYYSKLVAPWNELREGPVRASNSVLLDYVSPINIVSFFAAFKQGYIPVILSIVVFGLLKVSTIFSAALFITSPTIIEANSTSAIVTEVFDASSFDPSVLPEASFFSSAPVYSTLGNIAYGLPYAPGVQSDFAYIPVSLGSNSDDRISNATFSANTTAFFPNLACENLNNVGWMSNRTMRANKTTSNATSNYVELQLPNGNICNSWKPTWVYAMNPQRQKTPPRQLQGTMQRVYCSGNQNGSSLMEPAGLLFTITDVRYTQRILPNNTITSSTRNVAAMTNMLCVPDYYMLNAEIFDNSAIFGPDAIDIRMSAVQNNSLSNLSGKSLVILYDGIMNASQGIFGTDQDNPEALEVPNTVFNMMALEANRTTLESLLDPQTLQAAAETTFRRVMSHYAAQSLTKAVPSNITANALYYKEKIHLSVIPFYVVLVCIAVAAMCTIVLLLVSPGPIVPKDPTKIAMLAIVLARSPDLNRILRKQISSKTSMVAGLDEHEFGTAIATTDHGTSSFKIVASDRKLATTAPVSSSFEKWWSPDKLLLPAVVLAVSVPFALIGVLQFLQNRSDNHQGLTNITITSYTALLIRCLPVLVLILVASNVNILNFYVTLLSPWNKLAEGNAIARRTILSQLLGKFPPLAFMEAIQARHIGAIFSIAAAVLASVFAIVASGLYSVKNETLIDTPQEMTATSVFQLGNGYNVFDDNGAAGIVAMVNRSELPYPDGTFDNLVFPTYATVGYQNLSTLPISLPAGPFTATVPALRGNLRCDLVPLAKQDINYVSGSKSYGSDHYRIDSHYNLPQSCHLAGMYGNSSHLRFRNIFNVTNKRMTTIGGKLLDLVFGQNAGNVSNYGEKLASTEGDSPPVGCPSLAFTLAQFNGSSQDALITTLVCYQQIQQLNINVTYQANSNQLDPNHEPVVLNSPIILMTNPNSSTNAFSFDWRIQLNVERQLFGLDGERLASQSSLVNYQFDAFFSYLFNNTYKEDPSQLTSPADVQQLTEIINSLYSTYIAQAINGNMRQTSNSTTSPISKRQSSPSTSTLSSYLTQPRIIQNNASKLILQILLGVAAFFAILAYTFTTFRHLLPYNPCTIAGTMSLLAGSDLCYSSDDGLCDCCGKPRRSSWSHEQAEESIHADPGEFQGSSDTTFNSSNREQVIPDGAEWLDHIGTEAVFAGKPYSLGWWREDRGKARRRHFGIDIGVKPDGENDDDWELGDRRFLGQQQGFEGFMMRGRDALGDRRGQYQQAEINDIGPMPMTRPGNRNGVEAENENENEYDIGTRLPRVQSITSPRRVRFEDDMYSNML